ncbi:hypothetical protein [Shewanella aestuarii]|uniref:Helix-turn-helix domain-containing protein n=1 Tax=Shewanella aestuarii TaxID=1028752 RepID=A0A6G9QRB9_9GAMM|nr:hypothetical protein [Shewanella aestuarii]QIR16577.1 hypothetical protein HBH39_19065 [Shewanella aestuarii]
MTKLSTNAVAELMMKSDAFYTASSLGCLLNVSARTASGYLYNIRKSKKYQTIDTGLPNRQLKVIGIDGHTVVIAELWKKMLSQPFSKVSKL